MYSVEIRLDCAAFMMPGHGRSLQSSSLAGKCWKTWFTTVLSLWFYSDIHWLVCAQRLSQVSNKDLHSWDRWGPHAAISIRWSAAAAHPSDPGARGQAHRNTNDGNAAGPRSAQWSPGDKSDQSDQSDEPDEPDEPGISFSGCRYFHRSDAEAAAKSWSHVELLRAKCWGCLGFVGSTTYGIWSETVSTGCATGGAQPETSGWWRDRGPPANSSLGHFGESFGRSGETLGESSAWTPAEPGESRLSEPSRGQPLWAPGCRGSGPGGTVQALGISAEPKSMHSEHRGIGTLGTPSHPWHHSDQRRHPDARRLHADFAGRSELLLGGGDGRWALEWRVRPEIPWSIQSATLASFQWSKGCNLGADSRISRIIIIHKIRGLLLEIAGPFAIGFGLRICFGLEKNSGKGDNAI